MLNNYEYQTMSRILLLILCHINNMATIQEDTSI